MDIAVRKHSEETRIKMSESHKGKHVGPLNCMYGKTGDKNPNFGKLKENVGYVSLHLYVRQYFPKPDYCQICGQIKRLDLACVTGIYKRDFSNWKYLCRRCHKRYDIDINN